MKDYHQRNATLLTLGFKSYDEYLCSELWESIRLKAFETFGYWCKVCHERAYVLHHTNYSLELLNGDTVVGLVPLCNRCHHIIEFDGDDNKVSLQEANRRLVCYLHPKKTTKVIRKPKNKNISIVRKLIQKYNTCKDTDRKSLIFVLRQTFMKLRHNNFEGFDEDVIKTYQNIMDEVEQDFILPNHKTTTMKCKNCYHEWKTYYMPQYAICPKCYCNPNKRCKTTKQREMRHKTQGFMAKPDSITQTMIHSNQHSSIKSAPLQKFLPKK